MDQSLSARKGRGRHAAARRARLGGRADRSNRRGDAGGAGARIRAQNAVVVAQLCAGEAVTDDQLPPPAPRITVQCYVPRAAFDALETQGLRFESSTEVPHTQRGQVRLTMQLAVATQLLEQVRARGASTESANELLGYAAAAKNLIAAIGDALSRR